MSIIYPRFVTHTIIYTPLTQCKVTQYPLPLSNTKILTTMQKSKCFVGEEKKNTEKERKKTKK